MSKEEISIEYRGFKIIYDMHGEIWATTYKGRRQENASLKNLKSFIDRTFRKKFEPIEAYISQRDVYNSNPKYVKAFITQVGTDGYFFVRGEGVKPRFVGGYHLYLPTKENLEDFRRLEEINKEQEALRREEREIDWRLKKIDAKKIIKEITGKDVDE